MTRIAFPRPLLPRRRLPLLLGGLIVLSLFLLSGLVEQAEAAGRIEGQILDIKSGEPLAYANVVITGTTMGAMTQTDGSFSITSVPAGTYTAQVTYVGYETVKREVVVGEGETLQMTVRLKPTEIRAKEITITADRPLVDVKRASTIRSFNEEELRALALQPTLDSIVEQLPGVTKDNDQIHIRGGRADETLFIVDGVKTRDLLSGDSGGDMIGSRSIAEVNIITGGFDAKYGQALSGIVEAKLKSGTEDWRGYIGYTTDHLVDDQNIDFYEFQLSGPLNLLPKTLGLFGIDNPGKAKFFLNLSADLKDGWLPSISDLPGDASLVSSYEDNLLGKEYNYKSFFYPRAGNRWRFLLKSSWRPTTSDKFDVSFTKSLRFHQGFSEADIGDINRNVTNYPWIWSQRFDHYYTISEDLNTFSLIWHRGVTQNMAHTLALTRFYTSRHRDVRGKNWYEYQILYDEDELSPEENTPYFHEVGDAPDYRNRFVETWSLASDWSYEWRRHKVDWGLSHQLENVQYMTLNAASIDTTIDSSTGQQRKPLGTEFDLFHVYPSSGALYLQDRIEYESLIASVGLRYDYWFPGEQVERLYEDLDTFDPPKPTINEDARQEFYDDTHSLFGRRFKGHLSPRLQVSHPITNKDHLFFNYGHFSQRPAYFYVYAKSASQSEEEFPRIGNPNLNPEISVQYELGGGHTFRPDLAAKSSLFYKDIYDYPTSTTLELKERETARSSFYIYQNIDYARSTGIELELRKRRFGHWSGALSYTYSVAKGKSSDPNSLKLVQETGGDARETKLGEVFMWWNRPHKLTLWYALRYERGENLDLFGLTLPDDWNMSIYSMFQSGRAYTPRNVEGDPVGQEYSRNGPFETNTNFKIRKGLDLFGQRVELSLEIFNLFNHRTPLTFDHVTGEKFAFGKGSLTSPYENPDNLEITDDFDLIETVSGYRPISPDPGAPDYDQQIRRISDEANGIRDLIRANVTRYSNPAYLSAPRSIRFGVGIDW